MKELRKRWLDNVVKLYGVCLPWHERFVRRKCNTHRLAALVMMQDEQLATRQ